MTEIVGGVGDSFFHLLGETPVEGDGGRDELEGAVRSE